MTERTLEDIQRDFDTGARVQCTLTGRIGIVLMRDSSEAWVLWDDAGRPARRLARQLVGLPAVMTATEKSKRRAAALDCSSVEPDTRTHVDPFDTGSLEKPVNR